MEGYFKINEVSKITGLSTSNIRYYESEGLIKGVCRNNVGVRNFDKKQIEWINFLSKLKNMEMPLSLMKEYAILREIGDSTISQRVKILEEYEKYLNHKIVKIQDNIDLLNDKIAIYAALEEKSHE